MGTWRKTEVESNLTAKKVLPQPDKELSSWQKKLLPFMTYTISGLTIFFFLASFGQLIFLHLSILKVTEMEPYKLPDVLLPEVHLTSEEILAAGRLQALIILEHRSMERLYHQANVSLMSRVWINYLGFVTGMILALVGATFILGKLREPPFKTNGDFIAGKFSFEGTSPGIFLVIAGIILMVTTIVTHHEIEVTYSPVYLPLEYETTMIKEQAAPKPPLSRPEELINGE